MTPSARKRQLLDESIAAGYQAGMAITEIMSAGGVSRETVYASLRRQGIPLRRNRKQKGNAMETDINRRYRIELCVPVEIALREAVTKVDALDDGAAADPELTAALELLKQAQTKVSDYVDRHVPTSS